MNVPQAFLAGAVTKVAFCWRLTRSDGVVLGFTSHDRSLLLDGVEFVSQPGITPSAVSQSDALGPDSMEISGVLDAAAIGADDLDSGRWRDARVELIAVDWSAPATGVVKLLCGAIGEISRPIGSLQTEYRVELLSDLRRLGEARPLRISPSCRAELGDARCGVDLGGRKIDVAIIGSGSSHVLLAEPIMDFERFAAGGLRFLDGPLCGVDRRISTLTELRVELEDELGLHRSLLGRVRLTEGCDKRLATCASRFGNAVHFDGEPHVPGTDSLLRYEAA